MYASILNALKNEKAIDAFDMINIYKKRNCTIPVLRPIVLMRRIQSNLLLKLIMYSLSFTWIFLFPLLMLFKLFKYIRQVSEVVPLIEKHNGNLMVMTSSRMGTVVKGVEKKNIPTYFLNIPWVNSEPIDGISINLMSIISIIDLFKVLKYSLKGMVLYMKDIKHPVEILQTYVLFEYFMLYIGLEKLKKQQFTSYWYANQYDRWAVLLDTLGKFNTLLQHGFVNENLKLPYRMKNVDTFYYIDEKSIDIFKNNIIDFRNDIKVVQLKNTLELQAIKNINKSILLISRPAQLEFDIELLQLLKNLDIIIYIKPHPLFTKVPYTHAFKDNKKCILIEDDSYYPDVNIVISGYSTLAIEYELLGKMIIWIPKETKEKIFNKIIGEINV